MSEPKFYISPLAHVEPGAIIGEGSRIEGSAWIGSRAVIGANCRIEHGATVGYGDWDNAESRTIVGNGCLIATGAVLYHQVTLADGVKIRHNVVVREHVSIREGTSIGTGCNIEHHTRIGKLCSIHGHCHITDFSVIEDYVFIGPSFASFSDIHLDYRRPQLHRPYAGITIRSKARVGGRVTALPGSEIGEEAVIGAGSTVRGTLQGHMVYVGNPARAISRVPKEHHLSLFD
jgi:UDP-2-acetamido-3-amino-2,3-dideoxy-glucuronate N-acetyltransferase